MTETEMKKILGSLIILSILFLQLCWIPNTNSTFTNTISQMNGGIKPVFGQKTVIIILADFPDMNFTDEKKLIEQRAANMTSYFSEVSYNKMLLQVHITNKTYTMPQNMSFYSNQLEKLAKDCISQADPEINYESYDYFLVVHPTGLASARCYRSLHILTDDGKTIDSVAILGEFHSLVDFCHETAHLLGLPDLYPEASYTQGDVGCWGLMGVWTTSQIFDGPPQLSAWSRIRLGWINSSLIKTVNVSDTSEVTELYDLETAPNDLQIKVIKVAITSDIYYLVELRNQILFDKNLPKSGVLIYRCDDSAGDAGSHSVIVMDTSLYDFWGFEKAHSDAAFDNDRRLFCDPVNRIAIEVLYLYASPWPEIPSSSHVRVYRKQTLHSLKVALPQSGVWVTIDDRDYVSDENGEAVAIVLSGNHTVTVSLPSSLLYTNASLRWNDGDTSNPREIQVLSDTTLACFFLTGEREEDGVNYPLIILALTIVVALLTISLILMRRRKTNI